MYQPDQVPDFRTLRIIGLISSPRPFSAAQQFSAPAQTEIMNPYYMYPAQRDRIIAIIARLALRHIDINADPCFAVEYIKSIRHGQHIGATFVWLVLSDKIGKDHTDTNRVWRLMRLLSITS